MNTDSDSSLDSLIRTDTHTDTHTDTAGDPATSPSVDPPAGSAGARSRGSRHRRSETSRRRAPGRATRRTTGDGAARRTVARNDHGRIGAALLPVRLAQIVSWEIALVLIVVGWDRSLSWWIATVAVAIVLVAVTSVRVHRLCGYQWLVVALRYRWREHSRGGADAVAAALPDLAVQVHFDRAGNRVGLATLTRNRWSRRAVDEVGDDWTGVVRVAAAAGQDTGDLVDVVRRAAGRTDIVLAAAQLVSWSVPTPQDGPPVTAYWLAVHYRRSADPVAARARGGGATGATRAAAVAALGLARDLAEAGYVSTVLDEEELRRELLVALGADVFAAPTPAGPDDEDTDDAASVEVTARETWRDWSVGRVVQTAYRPRRPDAALARFGEFLPGSTFTCWSVTLRRDRRHAYRQEVVLRVGLTDEQTVDTSTLGLVPLFGRQGPSVRATIPLAAD